MLLRVGAGSGTNTEEKVAARTARSTVHRHSTRTSAAAMLRGVELPMCAGLLSSISGWSTRKVPHVHVMMIDGPFQSHAPIAAHNVR